MGFDSVSLKAGFLGLILSLTLPDATKAEEFDIGASAAFHAAISFGDTTDINFANISYTDSASGTISLGTDNALLFTDGYSGGSIGNAGSAVIDGDTGESIDIYCDMGGALSDGTQTIPLQGVEVAIQTGVPFGSGAGCQGMGSPATSHTIDGIPDANKLLIGAQIDGSTTPNVPGIYSTGNSGGDPITIRVLYQ